MFRKPHYILILSVAILFSGCRSGNQPALKSESHLATAVPSPNNDFYQEIAQDIGLIFKHSIGEEELNNIIESDGGGAAFLDYNQDGFIDIYACSGTWIEGFIKSEKPAELPGGNKLFRNKGDGTFEDVTKKAGVGGPWYSMGVSCRRFQQRRIPRLIFK